MHKAFEIKESYSNDIEIDPVRLVSSLLVNCMLCTKKINHSQCTKEREKVSKPYVNLVADNEGTKR